MFFGQVQLLKEHDFYNLREDKDIFTVLAVET